MNMKEKQVIKIGTKVKHTLFGGSKCEGVVTYIEKCKMGSKNGRPIEQVDFNKKVDYDNGTECIFDLDNGHWCYGSQILSIVEQ
jgi:hypothetical protein